MTTKHTFKRAHLRAPLKVDLLYVDDKYVHAARTLNISEGGILIDYMPKVPDIRALPIMMPVVYFPDFTQMSHDEIKALELQHLDKFVMRFRAKIVRSFEGMTDVEKIFVNRIGCEFVKPDMIQKKVIADYVTMFARNIVFLLNLFQQGQSVVPVLRHTAGLLGYNSEEKLNMLRLKVLHDYQSLESL
ncbi:MAG: hypothetical protein Fur0010_27180 [Bdellovibrio sp.]